MAEKKDVKKNTKKISAKKISAKKISAKKISAKKISAKKTTIKTKSKAKNRKIIDESMGDGIVIVDDDVKIDQEKVNEERRAYLEEARSQEAID